jgi:hypothetical protein
MPLIVPGIMQEPEKKHGGASDDKKKEGEHEKAQAAHFAAAPGPVIPEDTKVFEQKPSREELEARARSLNQQ